MDFGRLKNVEEIDFALPLLAAGRSFSRSDMRVYVGTPSLAAPHFARRFYPAGVSGREHLKHYSKSFSALELNSSFYALPSAETVASWKAAMPAGFRLSPKISKIITHDKRLRRCADDLALFCDRFTLLGESLGRAFLQLPPDLGYEDGAYLKQILEAAPLDFPLSVEFRHPSWFEAGPQGGVAIKTRVLDFLEARQIGLVVSDVAGRRDVCHGSWSARSLIVRCQGYELVPSDFTRLEAWADRLSELRERGVREVHFFLHQENEGLALDMAEPFVAALRARGFKDLPDVSAWRQGRQEVLL